MRFENAQTLFEQGKDELTTEFKKELANCMPRYLNLLLNASMRDKIREIRIEGHTDDVPYPGLDPDPYFANLILSQRRALKVMRYIQSMPEYQAYSEDDRKQLEFWFTVAGMSFGRALDVTFKEDACRSRKGFAAQNLSCIRKLALQIVKSHSDKRSIKKRLFRAAISQDYLREILASAII